MAMVEVLVNDAKSGGYEFNGYYFAAIHQWAEEHCVSYRGMHIQDVSDVSLLWDEIAAYRFADEQDALIFKLKWL